MDIYIYGYIYMDTYMDIYIWIYIYTYMDIYICDIYIYIDCIYIYICNMHMHIFKTSHVCFQITFCEVSILGHLALVPQVESGQCFRETRHRRQII